LSRRKALPIFVTDSQQACFYFLNWIGAHESTESLVQSALPCRHDHKKTDPENSLLDSGRFENLANQR
jgi:hypothetical protein